jgi:hypothetical protein
MKKNFTCNTGLHPEAPRDGAASKDAPRGAVLQ